ncbi:MULTISPECIES: LysR family transcriptional regulator [Chromobacterium]|uniref:LysR family transcriptional regulator n=1 Tax=Chromobacterium aquaticum TaxID=467180 RepID=A0ABV8ZPT9_9NEIS|nr:LysR family transcriptional regulator [Chromobacterium aquaticum]MCD5363225.1 LysR family transcriptional regulator [Chromobacterium aquaticum]
MSQASLHALQAFRLIARHGSFTRAAAQLEISASALSQTLRQLEAQLGVRLLNRTTRRVGLTEAGQALLARVTPLLEQLDGALDDARQWQGQASGTLKLTLPHTAAALLLYPLLPGFMRAYPQVKLELDVNNSLVDIVAHGLDAGLRFGESLQQDMQAVAVSPPIRFCVVASPGYLQARGVPAHPAQLQQHDCLRYRFSGSGQVYRWQFVEAGRPLEAAVQGPLTANDSLAALHVAQAGLGLAYLPQPMAQPYLADGRLNAVLEEWMPPAEAFYLYYPHHLHQPAKLRVFIDYLRQAAAAQRGG